MKYSEIIFSCKGGEEWQQDVLVQELAGMGFDTFETRDNGFAGYIASERLDVQALEALLIHQPVGFEVSYSVNDIMPQNWNKVWESNFEPVIVADKCYVRATFHPAKPDFPYEIIIDPKMAFGTGHHQTTSLIMRYMLEDEFEGRSVLDMGCGTGILGILAAKLGASPVWAIDNDPICVESVAENMVRNGVELVTSCGSTEQVENQRFDVVLANINRNILLDQLAHYAEVLPDGGFLYISGFYEGDDLEVLKDKALRYQLVYQDHKVLDSWVAARLIKKQ